MGALVAVDIAIIIQPGVDFPWGILAGTARETGRGAMNVSRRAALSAMIAVASARGQTIATDEEWSTFIAWVRNSPPGMFSNQSEVFPGYQKKLIADGLGSTDAAALAARLQERSVDNPKWTAENFDRVYRQAADRFVKPDASLVEMIRLLRPGNALDIGMGQGRNAIFLAQQGWDVTGIDLSELGVIEARERARRLGARIDARVQDVFRFDLGEKQWDLICLMYFIIPASQPGLYQRIATAVRPGGRVIVEGTGIPPLQTLLAEVDKWLQTKLHVIKLDYREVQGGWGRSTDVPGPHLILQRPV
ncbi:MAG: class I SAM-dependent methyltransferase [Bryobacterales bacterium]|nr:class I SAM-dependent methyltransferase [Bryobacterales bacterium]